MYQELNEIKKLVGQEYLDKELQKSGSSTRLFSNTGMITLSPILKKQSNYIRIYEGYKRFFTAELARIKESLHDHMIEDSNEIFNKYIIYNYSDLLKLFDETIGSKPENVSKYNEVQLYELNFNNLITEADKGMYEQKHNQHDQPLEFKEKYVGTRMFEQYDYDVISNNVIKQYKNDKKLIFTVFYATNLKEREEKENSSKVWNEYAIALNELTSCVNKYSKTVITGAKPSTDYCIAVYLEEDHNPVKDLEKGVSEVLKKYHKKTSTGINFSAGSAIFDPEFTKPEVYQNLVNFPRNLEKLALDNAIETKEKELSSSVFK